MTAHGAAALVQNLAPGATPERLDQAEAKFGAPFPDDLRTLWSVHDGSLEEGHGFIESFNLLSTSGSLEQRESTLASIEFARESPEAWAESGGTEHELASDRWLPFAGMDSDALVVHGISGRVFECDHDDTPRLVAPSLVSWLEGYAASLEADDYVLEPGFGGVYLTLRDREAERRAQEQAQKQAAHDRHRLETPLLDQFRDAIGARDEDRCIEVLGDARTRDEMGTFHAAVAMLFAATPEPVFAAAALRPHLSFVDLTADQWVDVAVGGILLENHAIRRVAEPGCAGATAERLNRLSESVTLAPERRRADLEDLHQKLRGKQPEGWISRLLRWRSTDP